MKSSTFAYLALVLLLGLTYGFSLLPLGYVLGSAIGLAIATTKAVLIVKVFMEFSRAGKVSNVVFFVGLAWLSILCFVFFDYLSRSWDVLPASWNQSDTARMIGSSRREGVPTPLEDR